MKKLDIVFHLRQLSMFEELDNQQLLQLCELVQVETHSSGDVIVREGEVANCMYLIVEGTVAITKGDTVLSRLSSGKIFGEMALFEGGLRSATVKADSNTKTLRLDRLDFFRLLDNQPTISIGIIKALSHRLRLLNQRATLSDGLTGI